MHVAMSGQAAFCREPQEKELLLLWWDWNQLHWSTLGSMERPGYFKEGFVDINKTVSCAALLIFPSVTVN